MISRKKEKKELVIKLINEGKTSREIAKEAKVSLRDIGIINRELNKEPERKPSKSPHAKAFQMFSKGKNSIQVLETLDLSYEDVKKYLEEYISLKNKDDLVRIYYEYEPLIPFLKKVLEKMKRNELLETEVHILIHHLNQFKKHDDLKAQMQHEINCLELQIKCLKSEIPNGKIPGLN